MRSKTGAGFVSRFAVALFAALAVLGSTVLANQEVVLSHDNGSADKLEALNADFHFIQFSLPEGWRTGYADEIQFYGQRFGELGGRKGTAVIWVQEQPSKMAGRARQLSGALKLHSTRQFDLVDVPEQPGWFSVKLDPIKLPEAFAISVYTYSSDDAGVRIGLTAPSAKRSLSSASHPGKEGTWTEYRPLRDGRNWLLRFKIRDSLEPPLLLSPAELSGPNFAVFDDGSADGYVTLRKLGFMLRCESDKPRKVQSVYLHGKLDGNWFKSTRVITVMILDRDLKVLSRTQVPYTQFTNIAAWQEVKFAPVSVGTLHYICVEPSSSAGEQFLLGYDSSGPNKASSHGTTGSPQPWPFTDPSEASTNWMIRVKYAP